LDDDSEEDAEMQDMARARKSQQEYRQQSIALDDSEYGQYGIWFSAL
jgi:hypothetical protein